MSQLTTAVGAAAGSVAFLQNLKISSQTGSISTDLEKMAEHTVMLGFLGVKNAIFSPINIPDSTWKGRLLSRLLIGGGSLIVFEGGGVLRIASGAVSVLEKIYGMFRSSTMTLTDQEVQELRKVFQNQQAEIEKSEAAAAHLKVLVDEVLPALTGEVAAVHASAQASLPVIEGMRDRYEQDRERFEQASAALVLVENVLTAPRSSIGQQTLEEIVDWTQGISTELKKSKQLDERVNALQASLAARRDRLIQLQKQLTALSTVEGMQYNGIEGDAQAYTTQAQLQQKYEAPRDRIPQTSSRLSESYV